MIPNVKTFRISLVISIIIAVLAIQVEGQTILQGNGIDTVSSGSYFDSGGLTFSYGNLENSIQTICGQGAQCLTVDFSAFKLDTIGDHLYIYDGPDASSSTGLIGIYSKGQNPGRISSSTGCLTFKFQSNFGGNLPGWEASLSIQNCHCLPNMANCTDTVCQGLFCDTGGAQYNYSSNEDLIHTVYSGQGAGSYLLVDFVFFNLEMGSDTLFIHDGPNVNSPLIGHYTGSNSPKEIASSSESITFHFKSDSVGKAPGWFAYLSCEKTGKIPVQVDSLGYSSFIRSVYFYPNTLVPAAPKQIEFEHTVFWNPAGSASGWDSCGIRGVMHQNPLHAYLHFEHIELKLTSPIPGPAWVRVRSGTKESNPVYYDPNSSMPMDSIFMDFRLGNQLVWNQDAELYYVRITPDTAGATVAERNNWNAWTTTVQVGGGLVIVDNIDGLLTDDRMSAVLHLPDEAEIMEKEISEMEFLPYPNPSRNQISLVLQFEQSDVDFNFPIPQVFTPDGKRLNIPTFSQKKESSIQWDLDLRQLAEGFYFVRIIMRNGKIKQYKFVRI